MTVTTSFRTRRSFLGSLIGAAAGFRGLVPVDLAGRVGHLDSLHNFAADAAQIHAPEGAIEFESSDIRLVDGFRWAKAQALAYVRNGDRVGPWYEAALPGRDAFCMRDLSHMSSGAQLLGLGARTRNMLRQFAQHISVSKKWCTWWEITKDGKPAPVDYKNDHDFWYDLPANFDILDACYRQWLWTRNDGYLDEAFLNFYRQTVTDYVREWDHDHDGLLDHLPGYGHMGIATYDEDLQDDVLVGADLIAAQYAAYRAYAAFERARNQQDFADQFTAKAEALRSLYNHKWWDASRNRFYAALGEDGKFHPDLKESTGRSDIELPLYYGLTDDGPKTKASLDELEKRLHLDEAAIHGIIGGVEGQTYLPDIVYKYGRSASGYAVLVALMDPALKRREYPEVSFTVIGNLGTGLMGVRPSSDSGMVETYPQRTGETRWAALHHVPVGDNVISVRHSRSGETSFSNESGPQIGWRASFPGKADALFIDSKLVAAENAVRLGGAVETWHAVQVKSGETRVASLRSGG